MVFAGENGDNGNNNNANTNNKCKQQLMIIAKVTIGQIYSKWSTYYFI